MRGRPFVGTSNVPKFQKNYCTRFRKRPYVLSSHAEINSNISKSGLFVSSKPGVSTSTILDTPIVHLIIPISLVQEVNWCPTPSTFPVTRLINWVGLRYIAGSRPACLTELLPAPVGPITLVIVEKSDEAIKSSSSDSRNDHIVCDELLVCIISNIWQE